MSRIDDLLYAENPRGRMTAAWLTQFWKAWESLNGVGRHQLELSDQRRLQAQADSLYRVGFTAKRAAWMASERHGMPIGRMPNPGEPYWLKKIRTAGFVHLIEVGDVPGTSAGEVRVGQQMLHNYWHTSTVTDVRNDGRWVHLTLRDDKSGNTMTRKVRQDTLVPIRQGLEAEHRSLRRNPSVELSELRKIKGFQDWMLDHPDFKRGLEKYIEFHGVLPTRISQKDMPGVVPKGKAAFFVGMGKGVEETYLPVDKNSSKHGSAYIHKYADDKGKSATEKDLPDKICSVDGKTILTVGGRFKVSDWIRG